jgi:deazaflavin-dependent oxidoreductase (nitroreductase family)
LINSVSDDPNDFLYLTTTGRVSGLPREIEIWFVRHAGKLYIFAEHYERAQWVQNIKRDCRVRIRLGNEKRGATARILDQQTDSALWTLVQTKAHEKYGWGDGLPVELTPDEPM